MPRDAGRTTVAMSSAASAAIIEGCWAYSNFMQIPSEAYLIFSGLLI